jgi:uncharacterized tellurite resistance protein B-like protein
MSPIDLTDSDKMSYLANLWLVARADKALSGSEKALIEQVQKAIQAKRSHNHRCAKVR